MADKHHLALLKEGPETWNAWRASDPNARPDLSDLNFEKDVWEAEHLYDLPTFEGVDFSNCNLRRIVARNSSFGRCRFDGCALQFSDLCFSQFDECSFCNVEMQVAKIGSAVFRGCVFDGTNLSYCTAEETDFSGSRFSNSMFDNMSLVKTCFTGCELDGVSVYGISAWDLILDDTVQKEIVIPGESSAITLDNIELAQFIHLLIRNSRLRSVIDTITSKVVLILGRFTPEPKARSGCSAVTLGAIRLCAGTIRLCGPHIAGPNGDGFDIGPPVAVRDRGHDGSQERSTRAL